MKTSFKKRAVIFDVDGVMLDSEPFFAQGRTAVAEMYGLKQIGGNLNGSGMNAFWKSMLAENGRDDLDAGSLSDATFDFCLKKITDSALRETDGLTHLLDAIKDRYALAVGSSSVRRYIDFVLDYLGVKKYFSVIVCGDEVDCAKPRPDIYLKDLQMLGLRAEQCFVVEDSDNGMKAAVDAGIPCLGLKLAHSVQKLDKCARVFSSMRELEAFLMQKAE